MYACMYVCMYISVLFICLIVLRVKHKRSKNVSVLLKLEEFKQISSLPSLTNFES